MPYVRVAQRAVSSGRPHRPENRPQPVAPRLIPILQPPTFSIQSNSINKNQDEEQQQQTKNGNKKKIAQQILPTYIPRQNYSKQTSLHLSTQTIRYVQPKYSANLYSLSMSSRK
jgi:hypothetical protein